MKTLVPFELEASWEGTLKTELTKPYFNDLTSFSEKEYALTPNEIYPPKELIFNAFYQTPFDKVKVALVGQDPYHGPGQAHGLCFSVPDGIKPPPSLKNIFKELNSDLGIPIPSHGNLTSWAKSGVLLLNATLTVRQGKPLSHHGKGWELFTDAAIRALIEREDPVIFVLWGKSAQNKCRFILDKKQTSGRHAVLTAAHPSPFSAHQGFFGCRHFSKINQLLEHQGKTPIDWAI